MDGQMNYPEAICSSIFLKTIEKLLAKVIDSWKHYQNSTTMAVSISYTP